jgi:hypothetical protein
MGNWVLTLWSNLFTGLRLSDVDVCYTVFRREVLDGLALRENRFGFEAGVTARIPGHRRRRRRGPPLEAAARPVLVLNPDLSRRTSWPSGDVRRAGGLTTPGPRPVSP